MDPALLEAMRARNEPGYHFLRNESGTTSAGRENQKQKKSSDKEFKKLLISTMPYVGHGVPLRTLLDINQRMRILMLKAGITERLNIDADPNSRALPFASPVVEVGKKDGRTSLM
ncbi:8174_t:CDS:2 [Paraglomus occultum]|uniref:8174_t:CDS:1 n=1 Tax=Paraglomus occultum TaxID=144539 RepID=A0A9N9CLS5_9GLOM|nr:8174_t:CDS:2 [Paraglomus occultum]